MNFKKLLFFFYCALIVVNIFGISLAVTPETLYGTATIPTDYYFDSIDITVCLEDSDLILFSSNSLEVAKNLYINNPNSGNSIAVLGEVLIGLETTDQTPIGGTGILLLTDNDINDDLGNNQDLVQGSDLTIVPTVTTCAAPPLLTTTDPELVGDNIDEVIYSNEQKIYSVIRGNNISIKNYGELHIGYIIATGIGATVRIENYGGIIVIGGILSDYNIEIENRSYYLSQTYICNVSAAGDVSLLQPQDAIEGSLMHIGDCCNSSSGIIQKYYQLSVTLESENDVWGLYNSTGNWIINSPDVTRLYYNWDEGKDNGGLFLPFIESVPPYSIIIGSEPGCIEKKFYLNVRVNEDPYGYSAGVYWGTLVITVSSLP